MAALSDDDRLVTAPEAEQLTGVPAGTIRSAVAREQLAQWGIENNGRAKLYRLGDVRELARTTRRRRRQKTPGGVS